MCTLIPFYWKYLAFWTVSVLILTGEHCDRDGLFLLDGLCVQKTSIANVIAPSVFRENIGEVQVSVQGLGHTFIKLQLLEVWGRTQHSNVHRVFYRNAARFTFIQLTDIHPNDNRRRQACRGSTLKHQGNPLLHQNCLICFLWPQGGPCESQQANKGFVRFV